MSSLYLFASHILEQGSNSKKSYLRNTLVLRAFLVSLCWSVPLEFLRSLTKKSRYFKGSQVINQICQVSFYFKDKSLSKKAWFINVLSSAQSSYHVVGKPSLWGGSLWLILLIRVSPPPLFAFCKTPFSTSKYLLFNLYLVKVQKKETFLTMFFSKTLTSMFLTSWFMVTFFTGSLP